MVLSGRYCNRMESLGPSGTNFFFFKEFPGESGKFNMSVNAIVSNHAATGKVCLLLTL